MGSRQIKVMTAITHEVTLDPILLGAKFKRHADRVILRKAGVTPTKSTEDQK